MGGNGSKICIEDSINKNSITMTISRSRLLLIMAFPISFLVTIIFFRSINSFTNGSSILNDFVNSSNNIRNKQETNSTNREQCDSLHDLQASESQTFSQNGEDGVLLKILNLIGIKYKYYVEFGVQDGSECNTRILREKYDFDGLMMDGSHSNETTNLRQEFITESNTVDLFMKYKVPMNFDVLSVDVDTFDFWILERLLNSGLYRPRIIIVEVNPVLCLNMKRLSMGEFSRINSIPLTVGHPNMTKITGKIFDGSRYFGANPKAFFELSRKFGYEMLYCDRCSVNCFLVLRSELPHDCRNDIFPFPFISYPCYATDVKNGPSKFEIGPFPGLYGGHSIDTLQRPATHINHILLNRIKSNNFSLENIEASTFYCKTQGI